MGVVRLVDVGELGQGTSILQYSLLPASTDYVWMTTDQRARPHHPMAQFRRTLPGP